MISNNAIKRVFAPIWPDAQHVWTRDIFRDVFQKHKHQLNCPEDFINHSLCFEARTFLHGLLVIEDKLSMAHGLETRVPFLDNDLVDFAMRCPVSLKINRLREVVRINENEPGSKQEKYFRKTNDGKQILRNVMSKYVPEDIVNGIKKGFSAPDASWFRGESIEYVRRLLFQGNPRIYEYMDKSAVQELANEHLDGKQNRRLLIWSLLNFEKWCKLFLDKDGQMNLH